jgi:hypothetical protein
MSEKFLLPRRAIGNPTRLQESVIKAYWKHWYSLCQAGQPFTFKTVAPASSGPSQPENCDQAKEDEPENGDQAKEDESEDSGLETSDLGQDKGGSSSSGVDEDEDSARLVKKVSSPDQCHTDGEKIGFLRSLVGTDGKVYQAIVSIVVQMRVSICSILGCHL